MTSDPDLLKKFARDHSQDAFTEIVRRHLNLVYSAALRQIRSPQLAEEIAQSIFADLARVAATPSSPETLTPWLYAVTRRTAIDVIRKESRRQLREQIAYEMNAMNAEAANWNQIEPLLDDAMAALDETDRAAILLRYFENKSLREVGASLNISDDAAQKRVSRAVERLREFLSKHNVTIGASGLAVLISANAVQSAPIGLAATISAAVALTGTAVSTSTVIAATKTIAMTTIQKSLITATLAVVAGMGVFEAHKAAQLREQNQMLQQQHAPLAEQIRQLQRERDDATNRLAGMAEEIAKNRNNNLKLLKLRNEASGSMRASGGLAKENEDLKMKLSELEGRWFNVTNSPQFSMPYFSKDHWVVNGGGDPLEKLVTAAKAATDNEESKLDELVSEKALPLFSKQRWDRVRGIQVVGVDYTTNNGEETATVNTIIMEEINAPGEPGQPAALDELLHTRPVMRRWSFSKTDQGWVITGGS